LIKQLAVIIEAYYICQLGAKYSQNPAANVIYKYRGTFKE
jgi:hypothetical protein